MAQHDYVIDNSTGANVRADINSVLQAIASNNSGSSDPSTTVATQFFADTNAGILKLRNTSNNGYVNLFTLAGGVDVDAASNFNEDVTFTGASANIVFDKSDNALEFANNAKAIFGNGGDLEIFHDGGTANIFKTKTDDQFSIQSDLLFVRNSANSESIIKGSANGSVELYHDNSKKIETTANGTQFEGRINFTGTGQKIDLVDDQEIRIGTGDDIQIKHNGTNSFITNQTGAFLIDADNLQLRSTAGEIYVSGTQNGKASLRFNDVEKLETTSSGITVTGTVTETSDVSLKSNIQPLTNTLEKIQNITGYKYNLINSISPSMGVIAQDVEKVFPELVHGSEGNKTLQYSGLIGVLVEAVKDLSAKVAALEAS